MNDRNAKKALFTPASAADKAPSRILILVIPLLAAAIVGSWMLLGSKSASGFTEVRAHNGIVAIPRAQVSDGKAHFFTYREAGRATHFFVLQSQDGEIRAALDACDVCYQAGKGYRQDGNQMICINCNMAFRSDRINEVQGGCNPTPLQRSLRDGQLLLSAAELSRLSWYFPDTYRR